MWQLRKLSTNEPLSEAGPLPNNWGPIFGLQGFLEKIGDLSWVGPTYADQGWVELGDNEQEEIRKANVMYRVEAEKDVANEALARADITIEEKTMWSEYLIALEHACLCPDFACDPKIPARPRA